jgi:hypothetical protein
MKSGSGYLLLGFALIVAGVLFLLQNFGFVGELAAPLWAALFGAGGLAFVWLFATDRERWWALIPGFTLVGLGALIGFGGILGELGGAFFLGMIGAGFLVIYLMRREFWWALIPAGALFSTAAVAAMADRFGGALSGSVLFFGLALTFVAVWLAPSEYGESRRWALIPAGILGAMGLLVALSLGGVANYVWALALIAGGGVLLLRSRAHSH